VAALAVREDSRIAASLGHDARVANWTQSACGAALNFVAAERGVNWSINDVNYLVKPGFVCFDVGANVALYTWNLQEGMHLD
jgi:hypothetical protein